MIKVKGRRVFARPDASGHAGPGEAALRGPGKGTATIKTVTKARFYEIKGLVFPDKSGSMKKSNEKGHG
jgi:hypothetical protein